MAIGGIPAQGMLALMIFNDIVELALCIGRLWILRDRRRTWSTYLSDFCFVLFCVITEVNGSFLMVDIVREIKLLNKFPGQEAMVLMNLVTVGYWKRFFAETLMYSTQLFLMKVAFLAYYFGFKDHLTPMTRKLLYASSVYVVAAFIAVIGLQLGYCRPIDSNWADPAHVCSPLQTVVGISIQAWTSILGDILVFIISLMTVLNLQLKGRESYAIIIVFVIGSMSIVASVIRFTQTEKSAAHHTTSIEVTHAVIAWGTIELLFSYTAFCLPCLRVLFTQAQQQRSTAASASHGTKSWVSSRSQKKRIPDIEDSVLVTKDLVVNSTSSRPSLEETEMDTWRQPWKNGTR